MRTPLQNKTSCRRKQLHQDAIRKDIGIDLEQAISNDEIRKSKKEFKRIEIENSVSYTSMKFIKRIMDDFFLDPILGLFPVVGDAFTQLFSLPFIYVSLFKVKSIPLTLNVLFNILLDILIGSIPAVGVFLDFVHKSFKKNLYLIVGFVEDDREIIRKVNRRAFWIAVGIFVLSYLIYKIISWSYSVTMAIFGWIYDSILEVISFFI